MRAERFYFGVFCNPWLDFYAEWLNSINEREDAMRRFIRHPSDIPIAYSLDEAPKHSDRLRDVGRGGLCFVSEAPVKEGSSIHIRIGLDRKPFEADGTVAWCRRERDAYAVGVEFNDQSTQFSVRMIEQICHIEHYRFEMFEAEGRDLTSDEAAKEWVEKYAADFPA
ncbi:MAG: PilZ domain-containing protein [Agarilytica sp.]